jgi:hypothetical protein
MGSLIQTKGTQRLARLFNDRFDKGSIPTARGVSNSSPLSLAAAFRDTTQDLLTISDAFIAQFAGAGWPADGDDFLYPSATLKAFAPTSATNVLNFALPGVAAIPATSSIAKGSAVVSLDNRNTIPRETIVNTVSAVGAGGTFSVTLVDRTPAANPVPVTVPVGERICFTQGKHEQLVRRWRWYLKYDLKPDHHAAIRRAISTALDDQQFIKVTFQTVEDIAQKALTIVETQLNKKFEFDDTYLMHIILMTQQTTAPDPLDPQ